MATEVQLFRNSSWESIRYQDFSIDIGLSTQLIAPEASFVTTTTESIAAGQDARIRIDGVTKFQGVTRSGGTKRRSSGQAVDLLHPATEIFDATSSVDAKTTDEDVLTAALTNANTENSLTLDYAGTATTLNEPYSAQGRQVLAIFRDMMDRTGRVWWVDPATTTLNVEPRSARGNWQSLDPEADPGVIVNEFDSGSIDTVVNYVKVIGTGGEAVSSITSDGASITEYGKRTGNSPYRIDYVTDAVEAGEIAQSLLQPDPIPEGEIQVGQNVAAIDEPLVNQTVDISDSAKDIAETDLLIEKQTIEQGRATLSVGGGTGATIAEHNRGRKSKDDNSRPGSVYNTDRIAKEAVTANEIKAGTITANEIDTLDLLTNELTVSGSNVGTSIVFEEDATVTPDELIIRPDGFANLRIGTLSNPVATTIVNGVTPESDLAGQVGTDARSYAAMWANEFYDASSGESLQNQIDDLESRVSTLETYH